MIAELGTRPKQSFWQSVSGVGLIFGNFCVAVLAHPQVSQHPLRCSEYFYCV